MSDILTISFQIPAFWEQINKVRDKIQSNELLRSYGDDVVDATIMTTSELMENAIKYGNHSENSSRLLFLMVIQDGVIQLQITNRLPPNFNKKPINNLFDAIKKSEKPAELYCEKLLQIAANPKEGESGLGLYRILYEGEFLLDHKFSEDSITITARKKI